MSSVDLGSNFNFAILVLIMLLLVSQMEVGSTSTTVGSCTEPKLAGSIAQEPSHVSQQFNLTPDMTIMLFYQVAWYHMRATYWQDQEFSWCFYWLRCVKKKVKGNKHKIHLNQTCFQCLWASFWFLNRFAGAGEKVTAHSCGSHNSQASLKIRHSKI